MYGLLTKLNATVILHEKTIKFHPSRDTGVKGVFFFFVDCVVVWFCLVAKQIAKTSRRLHEKKNVNLDGNYQAPNGNRKHRQLVFETLKKLP